MAAGSSDLQKEPGEREPCLASICPRRRVGQGVGCFPSGKILPPQLQEARTGQNRQRAGRVAVQDTILVPLQRTCLLSQGSWTCLLSTDHPSHLCCSEIDPLEKGDFSFWKILHNTISDLIRELRFGESMEPSSPFHAPFSSAPLGRGAAKGKGATMK